MTAPDTAVLPVAGNPRERHQAEPPADTAAAPSAATAPYDFDLVVIGSGPGGQRAAVQAAKLGKRVAVVERKAVVGGVCINTGTIPSKTLREAALHLSGYRERSVYGASYAVKDRITMDDLLFRTDQVIEREIEVVRHQMKRNGVELLSATASFADPHTLRLDYHEGRGQRTITAAFIIIAVGTRPSSHAIYECDGVQVCDSDQILRLPTLPRSIAVVGGGVIGCEYATIFSALGARVTLIDRRDRLLPFIDHEIIDTLVYVLRKNRMTLRLGEDVERLERHAGRDSKAVSVHLKSGKQVAVDVVLCCIGRDGATDELNLPAAGLQADDRGYLQVDGHYRTSTASVFAVGDVVGFPSLASTSMEQGRLAACAAFGLETQSTPDLFPYGIYTIPEISVVGRTEQELTADSVPYDVGRASYDEIARGQISGGAFGVLKILFHAETRHVLGVSIVGEGATELIHIGQAVMALGGTLDYFVNSVFNYPTLAECYKTAAFDGINRLA
ncbi:MAG: Si-specific NAD(P)(+) transhydrogenase [Alphaproteobacteria bacterium]